jgi:CO/xanthine dehydrogenase FAD-binding subunit
VAAYLAKEENGRCTELRVALGGLAATPLLIDGLTFAKDQILDRDVIDRLLDLVDQQISPFSDLRGTEWYKRRMARLFVKRALEQLSDSQSVR